VTTVTDQRDPAMPLPYAAWRDTVLLLSPADDRRLTFKKVVLRLLREPFSGRSIRERQYALAGFALAVPGFIFVVAAFTLGLGFSLSFAGMLFGLPLLIVSLLAARRLGGVHRFLAGRLLRLEVAAPPKPPRQRDLLGWTRAALTDPAGWRACTYLLIRLPILTLGAALVASFWIYGLPFLTFPLWWAILHVHMAHAGPVHLAPWLSGWWDPVADALAIKSFPVTLALVPLGVYVVFSCPWKIRAFLAMDGALINGLLGPGPDPQRVRDLEQTRAQVIDDAAARLRQIERDLHDGAQAQMVAVAMKLGLAKEKLGAPAAQANLDRAVELVDAAHASAREAIIELRDLARGIHPPALEHGLGTALETLAASSTVPVELVVDLPERPSDAIETIAYFCSAELLTNVAKHSGARRVMLEAVHVPGLLRLRISDDGTGGARVEASGGLAGLAERLRTVDGKLEISSPPKGPTVVTVELPSHS
jgi:signal transduction histidine kinase